MSGTARGNRTAGRAGVAASEMVLPLAGRSGAAATAVRRGDGTVRRLDGHHPGS
jgi:hypothetical protein